MKQTYALVRILRTYAYFVVKSLNLKPKKYRFPTVEQMLQVSKSGHFIDSLLCFNAWR